MLVEQFVASLGTLTKAPSTNVVKDAAIFIHELQPLSTQKSILKKSATPPNCLAVSDNHVFAAQTDKGVVHVYSREKGNQESTVPFTERITSIALACDDTVLVLGSAEGRIFLWETATGRQITTNQAHLQSVTALAVDPSSNFLLSASTDSTIHTWSIPALLSFATIGEPASPLHTFTSHRAAVTDLALGHSASFCNIAISTSKDRTCLIWNYHANSLLRTYLLPSTPLCVNLDGADRAAYVGYDDGSMQQLNFYDSSGGPPTALQNSNDGTAPIQPAQSTRWSSPDGATGSVLSIAVSFDSGTVLTGHQSGAILAWDVGRRTLRNTVTQVPLPGPVTNLSFLPVTGYSVTETRKLAVKTIVKPKFGAFDSPDGFVPGNYNFLAELSSDLQSHGTSFMKALTAPSFPTSLLDEGLTELRTWSHPPTGGQNHDAEDSADFMLLDGDGRSGDSAVAENAALKAQIEALRRLQTASFKRLEMVNTERKALLDREQRRLEKLGNGQSNGVSSKADDEGMESEESDP